MSRILTQNAYYVLGLPINASDNQILARSKEILNRLRIEDVPVFDSDLNILKPVRNELTVKEATQILQQNQKKFIESFFWFSAEGDTNKKALNLIVSGDFTGAQKTWIDAIDLHPDTLMYRKNLALLVTLLFSKQTDSSSFLQVIKRWEELFVTNINFSNQLTADYWGNHEVRLNPEQIQGISNELKNVLSEIFGEFYEKYSDDNIISEFYGKFHQISPIVHKKVLAPLFLNMNEIMEALQSMEVSEDGQFSKSEISAIDQLILKAEKNIHKLTCLGFDTEGSVITLRDKIAKSINLICLDLHNNLELTDHAIALIKKAKNIAGTSASKQQYEGTIKDLQKQLTKKKVFEDIKKLVEIKQYSRALELIDAKRKVLTGDSEGNEMLNVFEKNSVIMIAGESYKKAHDEFGKSNFVSSKTNFLKAYNLVASRVDCFELEKSKVKNLISEAKKRAAELNHSNVQFRFESIRKGYVDGIKDSLSDSAEGVALLILIDNILFSRFIDIILEMKSRNSQMQTANVLYTLGWLTIWFYGVGIIFFILGFMVKPKD